MKKFIEEHPNTEPQDIFNLVKEASDAKMDFQDISSSNIRKNIREGHDISEFVTDKVKGYIEKNGLYKNK